MRAREPGKRAEVPNTEIFPPDSPSIGCCQVCVWLGELPHDAHATPHMPLRTASKFVGSRFAQCANPSHVRAICGSVAAQAARVS